MTNIIGYIYVLVNPSMQGIVKIGKTNRNPKDRVEELSNVTGVPTPFILVYQRAFNDVDTAERTIHQILESKGHRVSKNREFFNVEVHEVIDLIQLLDDSVDTSNNEGVDRNNVKNDILSLAFNTFFEGEHYRFGINGKIKDKSKAIQLFKESIRLGCYEGFLSLGQMSINGEGMKVNKSQAISYFREGAEKGSFQCYAELGKLFFTGEWGELDIEASNQSWQCYFEELLLLLQEYNYVIDFSDAIYIADYLSYSLSSGKERFDLSFLYLYKNEILEHLNKVLNNNDYNDSSFYKYAIRYIESL